MPADAVARVRRFNRTLTERIGALDGHYLGRGRSLGEARLLWEIGIEGAEVRELRRRLGLDSGYTSRLLRALEAQRLIIVEADPRDGRVRWARLTESGRVERAVLDRRSDELARSMLDSLGGPEQDALLTAMETVQRLLLASMIVISVGEPASEDAAWCIRHYFQELGARFEAGFDPGLSIPADLDDLRPPAGLLLIARLGGQPVGCGALKIHVDAPAEVKRMWVARHARGLGLGQRLLRELEGHAVEAGCAAVRLETNRVLTEAMSLYRRAGYEEVEPFNDEPYAHHWFEKRLSNDSHRPG